MSHRLTIASLRGAACLALCVSALGCGGGQYGHSRFYDPLGAEEDAAAGAVDFDPVMARREPEEWQQKKVSAFGVVQRRTDLEGGTVEVALSVRRLADRNLCSDRTDGSCRTTVSDQEHARLHARMSVAEVEDLEGEISIGPGSLLRVIGKLSDVVHESDNQMVLDASYYRHWPRGYYVTTASAKQMRK